MTKGHLPEEGSLDSLPQNILQERAENLSREELLEWSADMPNDFSLITALKGSGAILLSGPRGSGKSTLLKRAYYELLDGQTVLPAYVNFARSLALEPLFHQRADALQLFRQWVIAKIIRGVRASFDEANWAVPEDLLAHSENAKTLITQLEIGNVPNSIENPLSPTQLVELLEKWSPKLSRRRCVLLLDDAAHAFSSEQQREFFEIFRSIRTRHIAPKAAVYPGETSYSANFHIGHEAKLEQVWCKPEAPGYLELMRSLFEKRFGNLPIAKRLVGKNALLDYLAYASFGMPRAYLTMISDLLGVDGSTTSSPTKSAADQAILNLSLSTKAVFDSLAKKLPRLMNFVTLGGELQQSIASVIRSYNYQRPVKSKANMVAIATPIADELKKILSLMEYAGIIRDSGTFSRGNRGTYHRYTLHYAIILSDNALNLGKSSSVEAIVAALRERDAHAVPHTRATALLGVDFQSRCTLNLSPCPECGTARASDQAKFCVRCGSSLSDISIYDELLKASVAVLPLTAKKIQGLLDHTTIRTVQDIILDEDSTLIRSIKGVGPVWQQRIHTAAEEFISV